ncbi:MAG: TIGR01777 family oxidoreductase [Cyclobacteriaceae bacterium]
MKVLITGASGLVGKKLTDLLLKKEHVVRTLSRSKKETNRVESYVWDLGNNTVDVKAFDNLDAVIHLAGENVAGGRWTNTQKKKIISSRVDSARLIFDAIAKLEKKPSVFISASGVGYYGVDTRERLMNENDEKGDGFLAEVVDMWEQSADKFDSLDMRVVKLRIGVVLAQEGGALSKMITPVKFGVGSPLGKGTQQMSWIHIDDLCNQIVFSMEKEQISGVYNAVSSNPASNADFTKAIAKTLGKPLFLPNVPGFVLNMVLGEMAAIVTGGNKVSNEKIKATGFNYKYENLHDTLSQILKTN